MPRRELGHMSGPKLMTASWVKVPEDSLEDLGSGQGAWERHMDWGGQGACTGGHTRAEQRCAGGTGVGG